MNNNTMADNTILFITYQQSRVDHRDSIECVSTFKMAEKLADGIEQELTCAVCLDRLTKPKVLPCLHTYCQACIEATVAKSREKSTINCPQCRESHPLPEKGFLTNFTAQNLLELLEVHEADLDQKKSGGKVLRCENGLDTNIAVARCQDCSIYLCDSCWKVHQKMVATRKHQAVSLEAVQKEGRIIHKPQYCPEHEDQVMKLYCKTCSKPICGDCTYVDHRGHDFVFLKNVQEELRKGLESAMEGLTTKEREFQVHLESAQRVEAEHEANVEASERRINQAFEFLIEQLQNRRGEVLGELQQISQIQGKQIHAEVEAIELSLAKLTSNAGFGRRLLESGSDVEVATMASHTIERSRNLHTMTYDKKEDVVAHSWEMSDDDKLKTALHSTFIRCICQPKPDSVTVEGIEDISTNTTNKITVKLAERHMHPSPAVKITFQDISPEASVSDVEHTIASTGECSWDVSFDLPRKPGKCSVSAAVNGTEAKGSPFEVPVLELHVGTRVRRGSDWKWGDQGKNEPGTVVEKRADNWVRVKWDNGDSNNYRWGAEDSYDLTIFN